MSTDKLATLRAHSHRRVASNPFPIMMIEHSSDSSESDEGDIEVASMITCRQDTETSADEVMSITSDNVQQQQEEDPHSTLKRFQTLEIPDLSHSPTLNRYSVSVFDFSENIILPIPDKEPDFTTEVKSPEMAAALFNKIHRSLTNLTSVSSMESLERDDYRGMVLKEIIDTERTYLSSLDTLVSVFLPTLEDIVAPRDLRLLFPCQLEPLIEIHQNLLSKLEERVEGSSQWHGIVGDIFGRLCSDKIDREFISVYSAYMNEFKVAMQTLIKYQNTSPLFCRTANNCIKKNNLDGLSLSSFLLTPIQRLPRYELLLKQLMKHTPADHPDVYYLETAMECLHSDLTLLDKSIQACQFASTVSNLKEDNRGSKRNIKKSRSTRKRHQSSRFARIKRHFSQANIDDLGTSNDTPTRRSVSALGKASVFAISEFNILDKVDSSDSRPSSSLGARTFKPTTRAISCSEVHLLDDSDKPLIVLDSDHNGGILSRDSSREDDDGNKLGVVFPEDEERTPCLSHSSSITSHDSIAIVLNKRGSVYSNNSSNTSGFDSLTGVTLETEYYDVADRTAGSFDNTSTALRMMSAAMASTSSNDSGFVKDGGYSHTTGYGNGAIDRRIDRDRTPTAAGTSRHVVISSTPKSPQTGRHSSNGVHKMSPSSNKKKPTISGALKVIKKATSKDSGTSNLPRQKSQGGYSGRSNRLSIGDPLDFRHIQHGFSNRPVSIAL